MHTKRMMLFATGDLNWRWHCKRVEKYTVNQMKSPKQYKEWLSHTGLNKENVYIFYTVKKVNEFPVPAGMTLTKLSQAGII